MRQVKLLSIGLLFFVFSCSDDEVGFVSLDTSKEKSSKDKEAIVELMGFAGFDQLTSYIEYGVNYYEITYKTDYLGQEIIASGLVTFPDTQDPVPMLSFHNGTETKHSNAPTENSNFSTLSSMAGAGYIYVVPDYIGFGSSTDVLHPYYNKDIMASSIVDMLVAAKELAQQEGYNFDGRVFLSGYSEGGYATMTAHKELEENPIDGLELVASAPASGGYDVKGMQEYFVSLETYAQPYYLAYVALSYQSSYGLSEPLSTFFKEPYASNIPGYFDGTLSGGEINAKLTNVVADYLQDDFISSIDTDAKFDNIVDAFEYNSLDEWVPTKRMMMYHGDADITVPYHNSVNTYNQMLQLGADPSVVTFTTIEGGTHGSGFAPYLVDVFVQFDELK